MRKVVRIIFKRRVLLALLLIIQFLIFGYIINQSVTQSIFWETFFTLLSISVALHVIWTKGKEAYKISWILQVLIFPVYGTLFYLMFNRQTQTRQFQRKLEEIMETQLPLKMKEEETLEEGKEAYPNHSRLMHYLDYAGNYPVYNDTDVDYYPIGEAFYEAMLEEMNKAKNYIFFEFFIVAEGIMWNSMLKIMEEKVKEGVEVRVMYDDIGSFFKLSKDMQKKLEEKGIQCRVYNPFHPIITSAQNNRDHRKILSIDGKVAFTGGVNIADEYINELERFGHWKDNGIKLSGKGAWGLTLIFLELWHAIADDQYLEDTQVLQPTFEEPSKKINGLVQPFGDSPTDTKNFGEHVLVKLIHSAREYVYIYTPYLILDENLETALILAAESGIDVRIITPKQWDKYLVHVTTRSYYNELVDAGIKVYEYTPGFMHAKTMLIDGKAAVVGTINFDYRSLYLHFENAVVLYGNDALKEIKKDMEDTIEISEEMTQKELSYSLPVRIVKSILRLFAPLM
ncbi:cardiolipin synthase [Alkalibacterium iburiense]|uniref:Cardiolipin synthase n=1 Tax=Alkalibacterium iburiense TaxID=290589 RepID=A0ABP3GSK8_9LACT